ncbi:hypothetical protein AMJ44_05120 [candidate division WOR-1 bacterium DG_54_3]|uniref:Uncharacterized protein n=1 Tax=candidate division WOR-1 bacterium DG_54_3 TaxID=1703775 RepID=A0A0S7Y472_UNCSA|nr:MAG: hypothetical protein AMJ44_05120 [candidate division WOR-1 bacterium DG_54_3]
MLKDDTDKAQNKLTLDGITFKTSGNILFKDSKENPFLLAQSTLLEKVDGLLEHGMQMLFKKIKT